MTGAVPVTGAIPHDITAVVFTCPTCNDWQLDIHRRARGAFGTTEAMRRAVEAHFEHVRDDHTASVKKIQMPGLSDKPVHYLEGHQLPAWWVSR